MLKTREDLQRYIRMDKTALGYGADVKHPKYLGGRDDIWKFEILLRKCEYYWNNYTGFNKLLYRIWRIQYNKMSYKLGYTVPLNVVGAGLAFPHYGTIVINSHARIGENCRIHVGVNIGATGGNDKAPQIGNNVYIGPGAKIVGDIMIADNVTIGANAVVVKSITEIGTTWAGVPAKQLH